MMQKFIREEKDPVWSKVKLASIVVLLVALLFCLIGLGAPYWAGTNKLVERRDHIGLWRFCTHVKKGGGGEKDACDDFIDIQTPDWLKAAQAFMTVGMFGVLICIVVFGVYLFVEDYEDDLRILGLCVVSGFATAAFIAIAVSTFGGKYHEYFRKKDEAYTDEVSELEWAFYLSFFSGFMVLMAPIMLLPETYVVVRNEARRQRSGRVKEYRQPIDIKY
jgi:hypothetical protein